MQPRQALVKEAIKEAQGLAGAGYTIGTILRWQPFNPITLLVDAGFNAGALHWAETTTGHVTYTWHAGTLPLDMDLCARVHAAMLEQTRKEDAQREAFRSALRAQLRTTTPYANGDIFTWWQDRSWNKELVTEVLTAEGMTLVAYDYAPGYEGTNGNGFGTEWNNESLSITCRPM
jgi:hypothetical protein